MDRCDNLPMSTPSNDVVSHRHSHFQMANCLWRNIVTYKAIQYICINLRKRKRHKSWMCFVLLSRTKSLASWCDANHTQDLCRIFAPGQRRKRRTRSEPFQSIISTIVDAGRNESIAQSRSWRRACYITWFQHGYHTTSVGCCDT
jgi:hypothetical protein